MQHSVLHALRYTHHPVLSRLVLWVCVSLLLMQSMGLWHAVAHPQHLHAESALHTHAEHVEENDSHLSWLAQLFSTHHTDGDCQAFDQLAHSDVLLNTVPVALPLTVLPAVLALMPGLVKARWHALFQARGPPCVR